MSRKFWIWALVCLLITIGYLLKTSFEVKLPKLDDFKPSPTIRILLKSNSPTATIDIPSGSCEVWVDKAERPYKLKCSEFTATIEEGYFFFAGIRHDEKISYIEIITKDKRFKYMGGEFEGKLRLNITKTGMISSILYMPLEPYIARVLDAEIHSTWPLETLKAQAVAARSYALFHIENHRGRSYDLFGTSRSQAFKKIEPSYRSKKATLETYGLVMEAKGKLFPAYYISTCGGKTTAFTYRDILIKAVKCTYCKDSPYYSWTYNIKLSRIEEIFSKWLKPGFKVSGVKTFVSKNIRYCRFIDNQNNHLDLPLSIFRKQINRIFEKEIVKSMRFRLSISNNQMVINGNGWGYHGRGMCQYGAKTLGDKLHTYDEIVKYYYPGIKIIFIENE